MSHRGSKSGEEPQSGNHKQWKEGDNEPEEARTHPELDETKFPKVDQYDLMVTRVEFGDLHARLMALECLTISLLYTASDRQLQLAREMADYILPREGLTSHPLSLDAARHIN